MSSGAATGDRLRQARNLTQALADVLERERGLIAAHASPTDFETLAAEKLRLLSELEALGPWQPASAGTPEAPEWEALRAELQALHRSNERNGIAIARILGTLRDELALLTGQDRSTETYVRGGTRAGPRGRMHTRA